MDDLVHPLGVYEPSSSNKPPKKEVVMNSTVCWMRKHWIALVIVLIVTIVIIVVSAYFIKNNKVEEENISDVEEGGGGVREEKVKPKKVAFGEEGKKISKEELETIMRSRSPENMRLKEEYLSRYKIMSSVREDEMRNESLSNGDHLLIHQAMNVYERIKKNGVIDLTKLDNILLDRAKKVISDMRSKKSVTRSQQQYQPAPTYQPSPSHSMGGVVIIETSSLGGRNGAVLQELPDEDNKNVKNDEELSLDDE